MLIRAAIHQVMTRVEVIDHTWTDDPSSDQLVDQLGQLGCTKVQTLGFLKKPDTLLLFSQPQIVLSSFNKIYILHIT